MLTWIIGWYLIVSVIAFAMYGWDKRRAHRGGWRIPEAKLHLVAALGGWPGAFLARQFFRHKTRKRRFLVISWIIVLAHVAVFGVGLWFVMQR